MNFKDHLESTITFLLNCLNNQNIDRNIKINAFDCFGNMALGTNDDSQQA